MILSRFHDPEIYVLLRLSMKIVQNKMRALLTKQVPREAPHAKNHTSNATPQLFSTDSLSANRFRLRFRQNVARFRLYRLRFLQENMRFAAFFKIYQNLKLKFLKFDKILQILRHLQFIIFFFAEISRKLLFFQTDFLRKF